MENQNEPQKKKWYKRWWAISIFIFIFLLIVGGLQDDGTSQVNQPVNDEPVKVESKEEKLPDEQPQPSIQSEAPKQEESVVVQAEKEDGTKQKKQDDIRELYDMSKTTINRIIEFNRTIYLADKYPKNQQVYDALKSEEDFYKKRSGEIMLFKSSVPGHMEEFEEELKRAYDEIADALIINENISKYLAEYVRTANMEYRRKAQMEIDKKSLSRAVLATNRFISIAGKVGLDSEAMKKEIDEIILNSVK